MGEVCEGRGVGLTCSPFVCSSCKTYLVPQRHNTNCIAVIIKGCAYLRQSHREERSPVHAQPHLPRGGYNTWPDFCGATQCNEVFWKRNWVSKHA